MRIVLESKKAGGLLLLFLCFCSLPIQAQNNAVIQGVVTSATGEPLAGAFVKLKNDARNLTFMVISQEQGKYTADRLPPGAYLVQGIGGEFQSNWSYGVNVYSDRVATLDISLTEPRAPALPFAWPGRAPGQMGGEGSATEQVRPEDFPDGPGKQIALAKCNACHAATHINGFSIDREHWSNTINQMRMYMEGSSLGISMNDQESAVLLDYILENFSESNAGGYTPDPNSRLPRTLLKAAARKYRAVEFTVPTPHSSLHEVSVDSDGYGWVTQLGGNGNLGRLDPVTYEYMEIAAPPGEVRSALNGIWGGRDNKLWIVDTSTNRRWLSYDTRKKQFQVYKFPAILPQGGALGNTMRDHPNGTIWFNAILDNVTMRLDPATGEFTTFEVPSGPLGRNGSAWPYGLAIAGDGGVWLALNAVNKMARVDPETGEMGEIDIPTENAVPRKGERDAEGNVWFGLWGSGELLKINNGNSYKMSIYEPPTKNTGVYAASVDWERNLIWIAQHTADMIGRFDPKTETWTEFPLATAEEDHRRLQVDRNHPDRVWWSGNDSNRMGFIEVLD